MTTFTSTHSFAHTDDATFRAWVGRFLDGLDGVLLVQTADTGQIDPLTVTWPAINTDGGYAIYRFNDAAQATNPIFLKFYFGTDSVASRGRIRLGVGTGSNGTGTLTNERIFTSASASNHDGSSSSSYFCYVPGFLGISFFTTEANNSARRYALWLQRTTDAAGAPTDAGLSLVSLIGTGASVHMFYNSRTDTLWDHTSDIITAGQAAFACHPGSLNDWSVGADQEVIACFVKGKGLPTRVSPFLCLALGLDIGSGATFTTTLVGASATYIGTMAVAAAGVPYGANQIANLRYCMRWE